MVFSQRLVSRYHELKEALDCILLMQVGAFMQLMDDESFLLLGIEHVGIRSKGD